MGLLSSLFKKKIKKIDVESFTPYINTSRVYVRGVDQVIISIPYDKNVVQGAVILIWQPKNHSFLHIVYDPKTDEKSIKYHDGFHNISPGSIEIRAIDDFKINVNWEISDTWALDDHFVESYLFLGDIVSQYETKTIRIIENQSRTLSEESEEKIRKMIEKQQQKNMSSTTVFNT